MAKTSYIYQMVDTWTRATETYTAIKMDVTDTASSASSLLLDLQVDSVSKFSVDKNGNLTLAGLNVSGDLDVTGDSTLGGTLDVTGDTTLSADLDVSGSTTFTGLTEIQAVTDATLTLKSTQTALSGADPNIGSIDFYGSDASDVGAGVKSSITSAAEAVTGTELVTNGTFDADITGWTGAYASWESGALRIYNPSGWADTNGPFSPTVGVAYRITFDIVQNDGTGYVRLGGIQNSFTGTSSQTFDIVATNTGNLFFTIAAAVLIVDNVSVKELDTPSGTELVTNGTFDTDTTGWTASNATLSVVSGRLRVTNTSTTNGYASFDLSGLISIGEAYQYALDGFAGSHNAGYRVGRSPNASEYASEFNATTGESGAFVIATNTNLFVTVRVQSTGIGDYAEFDNISVQSLGIGAGGDSNLVFSVSDAVTNNQEAMRIKPDGKVGIGTTTPASELDVSGTLTSTGATVNGAATATAVDINASSITTGTALDISDGDALTTGTLANIVSNSSDAGTRSLVTIHNDHASATGTTPLEVINDAGGTALDVQGGSIKVIDGSNVLPSIRTTASSTTGLFWHTGFELMIARAGSVFFRFGFEQMRASANSSLAWVDGASVTTGTVDTELVRDSASVVKVTDGSTGLGGLLVGDTTITGGLLAAQSDAGANAFAAGASAGLTTQGIGAVAVGDQAGETTQGDYSIAVGFQAGETSQGSYSFGIGYRAGWTGQADNCVALGSFAGQSNQATLATAIGWKAGLSTQGLTATAVGAAAGETTQSAGATAVGYVAGRYSQGAGAVAIGEQAGEGSATPGDEQGDYAVAIGYKAGEIGQGANGIIISSKGSAVDDTTAGHIHLESSLASLDYDGTDWSFSGGNVGIDQVPTADLHLNADATTTNAFQIEADTVTTGNVIDVVNADALTTGSIMDLVSNSADAGTRSLVKIHNDNALAAGTTALEVIADGGYALDVDSTGSVAATFRRSGTAVISMQGSSTTGQFWLQGSAGADLVLGRENTSGDFKVITGSSYLGGGTEIFRVDTSSNASANSFEANNGYTVAGLPAGTVGQIARITDGDAALAWGATAVNSGAGATPYLVWYNGTNWTILGK